ncbi:NAD(P)/FAD-dependent oxidoreductase [Microcella daejeonensis]|uniref:NAD(P)/FAD-dependent oxidoreductase n=1 Tax=Microcella daejeonensis TaxID=2994971 RepID=A0A9E8S7E4_9MICO|nr:NAD(P)/FAD-dependent oxidoreductase [Microcella daejeonensis]WAB80375.1 NAD(P)/FAD-dependent oxidoreductase [Microcella daejeonensis]
MTPSAAAPTSAPTSAPMTASGPAASGALDDVTTEVLVVGAGPGGTAAALRARELGADVTVVEAAATGGTCVNLGCVPTRGLAKAARLMREVRTAGRYGIVAVDERVDWAATTGRVRAAVQAVREMKREPARFAEAGIRLLQEGRARFEDAHTMVIDSGRRIHADTIILAVGGHSSRIPIPGAELATVPEHVLDLPELPRRVAIIGAGNTGAQLVTIFRSLGSEVTVLDLAPRVLMTSDESVSAAIAEAFEADGVAVRTGIAGVDRLEQTGDGIAVHWRQGADAQRTLVDVVVMATGWPADLAPLALDKAGLEPERGFLPVDRFYRSPVPSILVVGDANGRDMLVQGAQFEGEAAAENAVLGVNRRSMLSLLPSGGFTDPDYGGVGATVAEARERDPGCIVVTVPFSDLDRAVIDDRTRGFLTLIVDRRRDLVLGAHAVGEHAIEIVQSVATAMAAGADAATLAAVRFAYPTYGAIIGLAARAALRDDPEVADVTSAVLG